MSTKNSYDYAELGGLIITLAHVKSLHDSSLKFIQDWLEARLKELQEK